MRSRDAARPQRPEHLTRRLVQLGALAALGALLPLIALAVFATSRSQDAVRQEVAARLRLTTALSGSLVAEQFGAVVTLVRADAARPRLVQAVSGVDPRSFDLAELTRQMQTLRASGQGLVGASLLDLHGILRSSQTSPELVGRDFSSRDYFRGVSAGKGTYVSAAFASAAEGRPFVVAIATYVRAASAPGAAPGRPLAVIVASVRVAQVQAIVDSVARQQGVDLWIADRTGTLVAAPGGHGTQLRRVQAEPIGAAAGLRTGALGTIRIGGEEALAVRQTVEPLGWTVFATVPADRAYAGATKIRTTVLSISIPLAVVVCSGILLLVSARRRQLLADVELAVARDEAHEASRQKSAFLTNMSHELRTPLNAILGFGQLLAMSELLPPQREGVEHVLTAGEHLLGLIDEVLDISRTERGEMRLSLEPVPVHDVVEQAIRMINPLAEQRGIRVVSDPVSADLFVLADQQRLTQVLVNLLANAVKYNRDAGTVTVDAVEVSSGRLRLSVADTGTGIAPEALDRLFEPFERLGAEHSQVEGTGLGLALSRHLTTAMGGAIGVGSVLGQGSTFWVELPTTSLRAPEPPRLAELTAAAPPPTSRATVLYVEDNASNVRLLEQVVAHRPGVVLLVAVQGRLAHDLAVEHRPDLVLLDLHLPDMSGEEVLHQLRADPRTATTPVVVLSADATAGQPKRLIGLGATGFLTKPFNIPKLLDVIDHLGAAARPEERDVIDVIDVSGAPEPLREEQPRPPDDEPSGSDARARDFVHDMVNLLGVTLSYTSLLAHDASDPTVVSALAEIRTVTQSALTLTRDLLDDPLPSGPAH